MEERKIPKELKYQIENYIKPLHLPKEFWLYSSSGKSLPILYLPEECLGTKLVINFRELNKNFIYKD